jgi:hypothetical protein
VSQEELDLAAKGGNSQAQIRAREKVAKRFYKQRAGMTAKQARSHMRGIDFDNPLTLGPPPPCPPAQTQWQAPGGNPGQYYGDAGDLPDKFGIHDKGATMGPDGWGTGPVKSKVPTEYEIAPETPYMGTTAAPVKDSWSVPGHSYGTGGGTIQRFIPKGSPGVRVK